MTISAASITPPLTIERAKALNGAMISLALEREGIGKCAWSDVTMLREASLVDLVHAAALVKADDARRAPNPDGSRSVSMVCDDRLVAAIYAFLHFALPPAHRIDDDDYVILKLADRGATAFLVCGVRETREGDDEEADAA